jgi:hypothetical protein
MNTNDSFPGPQYLPATTSASSSLVLQQKKRFLLFIKILFKHLDKSCPDIVPISKAIVADCTHRNRLGDPQYAVLMDSIERRLRGYVGEVHWRRAHLYMQHYMKVSMGGGARVRVQRLQLRTPPRTPSYD